MVLKSLVFNICPVVSLFSIVFWNIMTSLRVGDICFDRGQWIKTLNKFYTASLLTKNAFLIG